MADFKGVGLRGSPDGYVEPTAYLTDVLVRVRDDMTDDELDALLPDRWTSANTS